MCAQKPTVGQLRLVHGTKKTQKVVKILKNKDPVGETVTERVSGVSPEGEKKR